MSPLKYHPTWSHGGLESHGERPQILETTSKKLLHYHIRWWHSIQNKGIIDEYQNPRELLLSDLWSLGWHRHHWDTFILSFTQAWVTVTSSRLIHSTGLCPLPSQQDEKMAAGGHLMFFPPLLKSYPLFGNKIMCTNSFQSLFISLNNHYRTTSENYKLEFDLLM